MKKSGFFAAVSLFLTSAWIFHRLIFADPILERDDRHILETLHTLSSLCTLVKKHHISEVFAFQPIRDLTYFFDLFLQRHFGFSSFHFTNFALWVAIAATVYSLLNLTYKEKNLALPMTAVFVLHPIFVDSVGWISARKHLLSCFFILQATRLLIRFQKKGGQVGLTIFGIIALYSLSLFSQPINVLWPVWAAVFYFCTSPEKRRPGLLGLSIACIPLLILGAAENLYYYLKIYPKHTATLKWGSSITESGIPGLAFGRYIFNLLMPTHLSITYYPGSIYNLIGLAAGVALILLVARNINFRTWFPWFVFLLFPLVPVLIKPTNVFVSDTYILVAAFGLLNLLVLLAGSFWERSRIAYILILICFSGLSWKQAQTWESDRALWTSSYASEPTPRSLVFNAKYLMEDGHYDEAMREALLLESWDPSDEDFPFLFSKSVYMNEHLDEDAKISLLESRKEKSPWIDYYLATLYAQKGRFSEAFDLLKSIAPSKKISVTDYPTMVAEAQYFCLRAQSSSPKVECDLLIQKARALRGWNETRYSEHLKELNGN